MKQKRVDRPASANSGTAGIRCLALILFCFVMPGFQGISPDNAGSPILSSEAINCFSRVPILENCSRSTFSEKNIPEEEVVRFETGDFLRLGSKQNSNEIHYREFICNETPAGTGRKKCLQPSFRRCCREQLLSFQTIQSATLPVRAGPAA